MAETIGVGIVGYGGFGPFVHRAWQAMEAVEVRAVADSDPRRRPDDSTHFTTDWSELLTMDQIDLIAVITPPSLHADMALRVLEAGKHLLVDKPLATRLADADRVIEARDRSGQVAAVNFMLRFNPLVETLVRWSEQKLFGELRRAAVENVAQDDTLPPEHWFWKPDISGGILVEHGGHFFDLVDVVAGRRPEQVQGSRRLRNPRQEDQLLASLLYEGGLVATHYHEFSRPRALETTSIRLVFEMAQIDLEGWIPTGGELRALADSAADQELLRLPGFTELPVQAEAAPTSGLFRSAGHEYPAERLVRGHFELPQPKLDVYTSCLQAMMANLVEAIHGDGELRVTLEDGRAALQTALLADEDARR